MPRDLSKYSDQDLKAISEEAHKVSPRTYGLASMLAAIDVGIDADLELARRRRQRLREQTTPPGPDGPTT